MLRGSGRDVAAEASQLLRAYAEAREPMLRDD
jgi:hypothetical protein